MEIKMKTQIQSTVYPEIPCSNYIKKERNLNSQVSERTHAILLKKFSSLRSTYRLMVLKSITVEMTTREAVSEGRTNRQFSCYIVPK